MFRQCTPRSYCSTLRQLGLYIHTYFCHTNGIYDGNPIQLFSVTGLFYLPFFLLGYMKGTVILLMALVFKGPRWIFNRKTRNLRPACMEDTQLGTHKFVTVKVSLYLFLPAFGQPKKQTGIYSHGQLCSAYYSVHAAFSPDAICKSARCFDS